MANANTLGAGSTAVPVFTLPPLPPPDVADLTDWYAREDTAATFKRLFHALQSSAASETARAEALPSRCKARVWWPFTQHENHTRAVTVIDSAFADNFQTLRGGSVGGGGGGELRTQELFDACASWWTQGVGHGNAHLSKAVAYAAGRYGHVMFPENAHEPVR